MKQLNNSSRQRVLFLYVSLSTFTERDIDALKSRYAITTANCSSFFLIIRSVLHVIWADCLFCWFGSLRFLPAVLIARLLGKKIIIISGGYDVANVPEIKYGNMYGIWKSQLCKMLFRMAHLVISVSYSNARETTENAKVPRQKMCIIRHGFHDITYADKLAPIKKEKMVITVGAINTCTIYRKGLLSAARLSKYFPEVPFIFAGAAEQTAIDILRKYSSGNVEFTGYVEQSQLGNLLARAKVYLQLSIHEAFGCSVAEAMLHNCIPLVSDRYALPEVVGKAGISVPIDKIEEAVKYLALLLQDDYVIEEDPRERILSEFPMSKRKELLIEAVKIVLN